MIAIIRRVFPNTARLAAEGIRVSVSLSSEQGMARSLIRSLMLPIDTR
jgi:hypothetical protein